MITTEDLEALKAMIAWEELRKEKKEETAEYHKR